MGSLIIPLLNPETRIRETMAAIRFPKPNKEQPSCQSLRPLANSTDHRPWEANTAVIIRPRVRVAENSAVYVADRG